MSDIEKRDEEKFLIVIGRQYGSGGRTLGKMLAERLGVNYYDKSLLSKAAERMGYSPDIFAKKDERRPSLLRSLLSFNYGAPTASINEAPMSHEKIYEYQSRVIKEICEKESCVMVGRTADYVMRHHDRMVSIFVHAPIDARAKAILNRGETASIEEAKSLATKTDKMRAEYYNYFTNRQGWGMSENYDFTVDSSRISEEALLGVVKDILRLKTPSPKKC